MRLNAFWSFCSVNIKAENPDPSSSWRSLIPVIKVNISTVSILHVRSTRTPMRCREMLRMKMYVRECLNNKCFCGWEGFKLLLCTRMFISRRVVWRLGTTTSPRRYVSTLRTPSSRTQPSLHPATWTSSCTSSKARWRMCASCWFPVHATSACRMTSKTKSYLFI